MHEDVAPSRRGSDDGVAIGRVQPCSRIPRTRVSGRAHERAIRPPSSAWSIPSTCVFGVEPAGTGLLRLRSSLEQARLEKAGHHQLADVVEQGGGCRLGRRARSRARWASSSAASDAATECRQSSPSLRPYCGSAVDEVPPHVQAQRQGQHRAGAETDHGVAHGLDLAAARAPRGVRRRRSEAVRASSNCTISTTWPSSGVPSHTSAARRVLLVGSGSELGGGPGHSSRSITLWPARSARTTAPASWIHMAPGISAAARARGRPGRGGR